MSHDFDYIAYVPFPNYAGGAWLGTVLTSTQYSGSVVGEVWLVRQLKNNSSLTWATRFQGVLHSRLPNVG